MRNKHALSTKRAGNGDELVRNAEGPCSATTEHLSGEVEPEKRPQRAATVGQLSALPAGSPPPSECTALAKVTGEAGGGQREAGAPRRSAHLSAPLAQPRECPLRGDLRDQLRPGPEGGAGKPDAPRCVLLLNGVRTRRLSRLRGQRTPGTSYVRVLNPPSGGIGWDGAGQPGSQETCEELENPGRGSPRTQHEMDLPSHSTAAGQGGPGSAGPEPPTRLLSSVPWGRPASPVPAGAPAAAPVVPAGTEPAPRARRERGSQSPLSAASGSDGHSHTQAPTSSCAHVLSTLTGATADSKNEPKNKRGGQRRRPTLHTSPLSHTTGSRRPPTPSSPDPGPRHA